MHGINTCKGAGKLFRKNLEAFLQQSYSHYNVLFIVENITDPAYAIIQDLIQNHSRASLIVAGHAKNCGQKNWNLVIGLKQAQLADIYVFADCDIMPSQHWLAELILPLSDTSVIATTGYNQITPLSPTQQVHFIINCVLYFWLIGLNQFSSYVWGGSMAIRKKDFQDLGIESIWNKTVSDDLSLSQLLSSRKKRCVVVPTCLSTLDSNCNTYKDVHQWFKRQVLHNKFYRHPHWLFAIGVCMGLLASYFIFLILLITGLNTVAMKFLLLLPCITILTTTIVLTLLQFSFNPLRLLIQGIWIPFFFAGVVVSTLFTNSIHWSGIKYLMNKQGRVINLKRLNITNER